MTSENAKRAFAMVQELFLRKLEDYGTKDLTSVQQVIDRMREKLFRAENLTKRGWRATDDESVSDTFADLAGYAIIGKLMIDYKWGDEVETPTPSLDDQIQILRTAEAKEFPLPVPKKVGDVGYDLYTVTDVEIPAQNKLPIDIPTGIRVKLPTGYWALIINRSSTPRKLGIEVVNGVIDNGYTGELFACCYNRTDKPIQVARGTRIAQFLIFKSNTPPITEVDQLPMTQRAESGFGSTGITI